MSSCSSNTSSVSQGVGCELPASSHSWVKSNTEYKQSAGCNMGETNVTSLDLGVLSVDEKQSVVNPVVELNGEERVKNQVCHGQISVADATPDQDDSNEIDMCLEFGQTLSLGTKVQKCLSKCKTLPVSRKMQAYSSSLNEIADSLGKAAQGQDSSASGTSAYSRSISLPSSSTLVSAMKGGRALNGTMVKSDLCVKWAPEVYDPPATSMPHTLNRHNNRPKAKKKDKYKNKNKSSRGNGGDRKHVNRKFFNKMPDPQNVRLQSNGDKLVLDGFGKPKVVDIFEYGINGQEVKCGSRFLGDAFTKVHLPIGEAS